MIVIGYILTGALLGFFIGYIFAKSKVKTGVDSNSESLIQSLSTEKAVLLEKIKDQERSFENLIQEIKNQLQQSKEELNQERTKLNDANNSLVSSRTYFKSQEEKIQEQKKQIEELQLTLTKEFENIAARILDEKSQKFTDQNKSNLDIILNPLKERIKDFEEKVDKSYRAEAAERNTLKGSIEELMKLNKQISEEANNLTLALKGDNKKQGNWGELVLEKILEASGLVRGTNYIVQGKGLMLSDEDGNRLQPDVIINLPDEKHIIIDAKVSLVSYEKLVNASDDEQRAKFIKEHLTSIRSHITGLSAKNYQDLYNINSPDFVLLFIPIESSFSMAIQYDQDLFDFAWSRRIVLVTPSTLLATLKTVASVWKQEQQTRNALEIARKAGALYDKFVGFIEDLNKIGDQISKTQKSYEDAYSKLHTGKGNLVNQVEGIKKLGAKANKQLEKSLLDEDINDTETETE